MHPQTSHIRRFATGIVVAIATLFALSSSAHAEAVLPEPDPLAAWFAALDGAATQPADLVVLGDSVSQGYGAPTRADWFVDEVRRELQSTWGGSGSEYRPASATFWPSDERAWTLTGGQDDATAGLGLRARLLDSSSAEVATTVHATSFRLFYAAGPGRGSMEVTVDGTVVAVVDTSAEVTTARTWSSGTIGAGPHSVRVRAMASPNGSVRPVVVEGILDGDSTSGIRVWDASHYGYGSTHFATQQGWRSSLAQADPELVIIELGTNDYWYELSAASFEANVRSIIDGVRAAATGPVSIALLPLYNAEGRDPSRYGQYVDAQRRIADDQGLALIDLSQTDASLLTDDGIHPHAVGQRVLATNVLAATHPTYVEALVPGAATDLVVTAGEGAGTLAAEWSPVADATSYVVRVVDGAGAVARETTQAGTAASITGLSPGATYTVVVFAGSNAGFSAGTSATGTTTGSPVVVPAAPTDVVATHDVSTGAVRLTWTAPAGPVIDYVVLAYDTATGYIGQQTVTSPSAAFPGLAAGRSYIFGVYARNSAGFSPGTASNVVNVPAAVVPPAAPTAAVATYDATTGTMRVTWNAPAGTVTEYLVQAYDIVSGYHSAVTTTSLTASFAGLPSGRSYAFAVYARNIAGYSPAVASNTVAIPVKVTAPAAPTNVVATTTNAKGTVKVSWTAPAGPVTSYIVVARDTATGQLITRSFSAGPATFSGLTAGRTYVFTVQAVNAAGTSPAGTSNAVKVLR